MSDAAARIEKVCPVVLRAGKDGLEILAFRHPEAGLQLVKGTLEAGESPRDAAMRELQEESGLSAGALQDLGKSKGIAPEQAWHFFLVRCDGVSDQFTHGAPDDGGHDFEFFWQPMVGFLDEDEWDAIFIRAIRFVQSRVARMDADSRARFIAGDATDLSRTILELAIERGAGKSLCPSEVARHLAGSNETEWRALMKPIRSEAVRLAREGTILITRKGKPVDPDDFKGIYRIALPEEGEAT